MSENLESRFARHLLEADKAINEGCKSLSFFLTVNMNKEKVTIPVLLAASSSSSTFTSHWKSYESKYYC